jgi:hypothetical protein
MKIRTGKKALSNRETSVAAAAISPDVGSWHNTDVPQCPLFGRYRG